MTWNIERDADGLPVRLGKPAEKECPACGGTGTDPTSGWREFLACWTCAGTGRIARATPITSVDDERVSGEG